MGMPHRETRTGSVCWDACEGHRLERGPLAAVPEQGEPVRATGAGQGRRPPTVRPWIRPVRERSPGRPSRPRRPEPPTPAASRPRFPASSSLAVERRLPAVVDVLRDTESTASAPPAISTVRWVEVHVRTVTPRVATGESASLPHAPSARGRGSPARTGRSRRRSGRGSPRPAPEGRHTSPAHRHPGTTSSSVPVTRVLQLAPSTTILQPSPHVAPVGLASSGCVLEVAQAAQTELADADRQWLSTLGLFLYGEADQEPSVS